MIADLGVIEEIHRRQCLTTLLGIGGATIFVGLVPVIVVSRLSCDWMSVASVALPPFCGVVALIVLLLVHQYHGCSPHCREVIVAVVDLLEGIG